MNNQSMYTCESMKQEGHISINDTENRHVIYSGVFCVAVIQEYETTMSSITENLCNDDTGT